MTSQPSDATSLRDAALERVVRRLLFDAALDYCTAETLDAVLVEEGVASEDRHAMVARGAERLLLYRRLVEGTVRNAIDTIAPLTSAHIAARLASDVRRYLAEQGPRGRTLREVVHQFVRHCEPIWVASPDVPDFIPDLAAYELAVVNVAAAPDPPVAREDVALSLDRSLAFAEGCQLGAYAYRVNEVELVEDEPPQTPARGETYLLLYRSAERSTRCLRLSPLAHSVLAALLSGSALGDAVKAACLAREEPLTQSVLDGTATVLADLAELGVLLGPVQSD